MNNTEPQFPRSCSNIRKWFVTGGNMLVIVHNIAVGKSLFTTNSLTFDPLQLLEVDPHPSFFPMSGKICRWQVECNIQCDPGI